MSMVLGQQLGQYKLVGLLGEGTAANVYRARHIGEWHEVAVKVIKPGALDMRYLAKQLRREAIISASLHHPHIVNTLGFGEEDTSVYMTMQLVPGGSLAKLTDRTRLSLETIGQILSEVASALDYVHRRGIVHRDVKPQNILMNERGETLLSDFGLVKALSAEMQNRCRLLDTHWHPTRAGMIVGTPAYMSPEQCKSGLVKASSDIYSLGVVLFELLTGEVPFPSQAPLEAMYLHVGKEAPPVSSLREDLPSEMDAVVGKALEKDPSQRYLTAGQLAEAYAQVIGMPTSCRVDGHTSPPHRLFFLSGALAPAMAERGRIATLLRLAFVTTTVLIVTATVILILAAPF